MINRSFKNVLGRQQQLQHAQKLFVTPTRAAGGGPKKPAIPATERDFDVVLVGKYRSKHNRISKYLFVI